MPFFGNSIRNFGFPSKGIAPKNPEYYNEFKNISYSEQERLLANEKAQDTTEMEETYGKIIKNLEKANSVIADIK